MLINRGLSSWQVIPLVFMEDAVAASQTDAQLKVCDVGTAQLNDGYVMPFPGEILAISYNLNAAASAGSLTIGPTVGGTEKTDPTLTVTTGASGYDTCKRGAAKFDAGAVIGAEITTDGSWNGTASDLVVIVWVAVNLANLPV